MRGSTGGHGGADTRLLEGLDDLLRRAVQLVWLNLWWVLFTLRGGIVLGIGNIVLNNLGVVNSPQDNQGFLPGKIGRASCRERV